MLGAVETYRKQYYYYFCMKLDIKHYVFCQFIAKTLGVLCALLGSGHEPYSGKHNSFCL